MSPLTLIAERGSSTDGRGIIRRPRDASKQKLRIAGEEHKPATHSFLVSPFLPDKMLSATCKASLPGPRSINDSYRTPTHRRWLTVRVRAARPARHYTPPAAQSLTLLRPEVVAREPARHRSQP